MDATIFKVKWHHGGHIRPYGKYLGGSVEVLGPYNWENMSRLEFLQVLFREHFKYKYCGPLYYKRKTKFVEIVKDGDIWDMIKGHRSGDTIELFVEFVDEGAQVLEGADELASVANMCIRPEQEDGGNSEQEDGGNSEQEDDGSHTTEDELYDVELDDDEASERDEEVAEIKTKVSSYRRERSRRNHGIGMIEIELREAGPDIGFHDWLKQGNSYGGLLGGDEEYIGSSDVDSFASDVEEEGEVPSRRRHLRVHYDPKCEVVLFELGMIFQSVDQFRDALTEYAVKKGVELTLKPNEKTRVRASCLTTCPWHLLASENKRTNNFIIKTYYPVHTCYRTNTNRHCNTAYLTKFLRKKVRENPGVKIWQIQEHLKNELEIYVGRTVCRKAKAKIMNEYIGDYKMEFARLYDYRDEILMSNPGSSCVVLVDSKEIPIRLFFRGFYVCFAAVKKGFKDGCRRTFGIDGCFLKGICKGQMLVAVGKDGNNQIYPIAWAVVDSETKATYKWFLNLLRQDLDLGNGAGFTIVTDMQKGLIPAIKEELPEVEHRKCARHVLANWSKKWKGVERRQTFWAVCKSTFEAQLKDNLDAMSKLGKNIVEELISYDIKEWCRVYFPINSGSDVVDNNMSESFNGWILAARHKTIITMLEEIRVQMMKRFIDMRTFMTRWKSDVSPMVMSVLQKYKSSAMQCVIVWNGEAGFEVQEGPYRHVVDMKNKTCTCRAWSLKGIPCPHAIAACHRLGNDPEQLISHWYRKSTYSKAYANVIQPLRNMRMWPEGRNPTIEPPVVKPLPGRPRRCRRKSKDEPKKFGKTSRAGTPMTCTFCKKEGHNSKGCSLRKAGGAQPAQVSSSSNAAEPRTKNTYKRKYDNHVSKPNAKNTAQPKAKKQSITGYGILISERTGFTREQHGAAESSRVISTGSKTVKSSAVVTGDIGYYPSKEKWKGKNVMTETEFRTASDQARVAAAAAARSAAAAAAARSAAAVARLSARTAAASRFAQTRGSSSQPENTSLSEP